MAAVGVMNYLRLIVHNTQTFSAITTKSKMIDKIRVDIDNWAIFNYTLGKGDCSPSPKF
jgi:hypothetical protein